MPAAHAAIYLIVEQAPTTGGFDPHVHSQVVIKSDVQSYRTDRNKSRFNIGLGYML